MTYAGVGRMYSISEAVPVIGIIAAIAAIVLTVLICVFILPENKRPGLNKFFTKIHDLIQFKHLWIEIILKVLYVVTTLFFTIFGIILVFTFSVYTIAGILLIILGLFVNRLLYEAVLLQVLIFRNTQKINDKLGAQPVNKDEIKSPHMIDNNPNASAPAPEPEKEPLYRYCSQCGTKYDANKGGCPKGCE